jgi:hypothetical protein
MTGMQRLNLLAAMLAFLYSAWRGWPLNLALEKALIAYVAVFAAQILVILGLLRLVRGPVGPRRR